MKKLLPVILSVMMLCCSCTDAKLDNNTDVQLSTNDSDGYIQVDEDDYEVIAGKISYENTDEEDDYSDYDLVIAMISDAGLQFDIYDLAEQCGLKVKVIKYDEYSYLDIKLMAHDNDVDLFYTASLDMFKYIRDGYYVDLNEYDSLKTRLDSNNYTKAACSYDGKYFGISMHPFYSDYTQTEWSNTHYKYMCKNIDSMKGLYSDPDGEELYEVLKHHYNHPNDEQENAYYSEIYNVIIDEYLAISPFSLKKENAVKFLEGAFDVINGDLRLLDAKGNFVNMYNLYPDIDEPENKYFFWNFNNKSFTEPFWDAWQEVANTDGSDSAIRKLAESTARQIRMRFEG